MASLPCLMLFESSLQIIGDARIKGFIGTFNDIDVKRHISYVSTLSLRSFARHTSPRKGACTERANKVSESRYWGTGIRTPIRSSRGCSPTVRRSPNKLKIKLLNKLSTLSRLKKLFPFHCFATSQVSLFINQNPGTSSACIATFT